jgi:hypothetical protein
MKEYLVSAIKIKPDAFGNVVLKLDEKWNPEVVEVAHVSA